MNRLRVGVWNLEKHKVRSPRGKAQGDGRVLTSSASQ